MFRQFILLVSIVSAGMAFGNDMAEQNQKRIASLQRMVIEQNERIDGLTSLIEGLSASLAELKMAQHEGGSLKEDEETLKLIKELGVMIDKINANYVSRDELAKMLGSNRTLSSSKHKESTKVSRELQRNIPASKLYGEGVRLFTKKRYSEAKKRFIQTARKGYKPAASNYYLGEISYYTKQYEDAIFYYKKSTGLYDKASYMDVLLLHTGISLAKTGEKQQARLFYENLIENYPGKKSASIAKGKLRRL
jgi:TolA-binding protein